MYRRLNQSLLLLFMAGLAVTGAAAQQNQQSLADAAKHKPAKKAVRVITNDEIPSQSVTDESTPADRGQSSGDSKSDEASLPDGHPAGSGKKSSPDEQAAIQKELDTLNQSLSDRQKRTAEYRQKMEQETDEFRRNTQAEVLAAREHEEKQMMQQREKFEQQLADAKKKNEKQGTNPAPAVQN
jgi:hypothetical protein